MTQISSRPKQSPLFGNDRITRLPFRAATASVRDWVCALLASDDRFWPFFACGVGLLAFFRGVRLPGSWAATQAQLDYSFGFVKRGLFGEMMDLLNIHHYLPFVLLCYVILAGFILLLWKYSLGREAESKDFVIAAVFFSSLAFTYFVNLVGYLEIFQGLLVIATLFIPKISIRATIAIAVAICGTLIHELFVVVYLPLLLLDGILASNTVVAEKRVAKNFAMAYAVSLMAFTVGVALIAARRPSLSGAEISLYSRLVSQKVDFPIRGGCIEVLGRSLRDNMAFMHSWVHNRVWLHNQVDGFLEFAPASLFFLFLSFRLVYREYPCKSKAFLLTCICLVSLSPLTMNLFGVDIYRWFALASLNTFLAFVMVRRYAGGSGALAGRGGISVSLRNAAVLLIVINLSCGSGLMDEYSVRTFPFTHIVKLWISSARHRQFPLPPN
ncbi:MAG: hypothetical protein WBX22_14940 [Silvibacterium sp.]|jgi:hypothetical protein